MALAFVMTAATLFSGCASARPTAEPIVYVDRNGNPTDKNVGFRVKDRGMMEPKDAGYWETPVTDEEIKAGLAKLKDVTSGPGTFNQAAALVGGAVDKAAKVTTAGAAVYGVGQVKKIAESTDKLAAEANKMADIPDLKAAMPSPSSTKLNF
ncbi:MAG: hypothetical protein PHY92_08320 [Alphaproteobacteria bacterium]|nr:hypothetical protein [Alphaproteobacteria bacterium]